eukprot:TRINITY_DN18053_c0_g1_i2.p1 TRINITY_DN18053_c0_g1~~TRINITY_DN18053_c0_g1_i2.p1  ORF type:complete len:521 (-),score=98.32 TRINITY_DN18053_c0_g1_i2:93-1655(-)
MTSMRLGILATLLAVASSRSPVRVPNRLSAKTVDQFRQKHAASLVLFTAPWCANCRGLPAILKEVVNLAEAHDPRLGIGSVDCDVVPEFCGRFHLPQLPQIRGFISGQDLGEIYEGDLNPQALFDYLRVLGSSQMPQDRRSLKVEDLKKMPVKKLKKMLRARGVECKGCTEKGEFIQLAFESQHLEPRPTMTVVQEKRWDLAMDVANAGFGVANGVIHATHTHLNNWNHLRQSHEHMLVLFHATWCEHCSHAHAPFAKAARELAAKFSVPFVAVDCDSNKREIAECSVIQGFPEFWLLSTNSNVSFDASSMGVSDFEEFLEEHVSGVASPWVLEVTHVDTQGALQQFAADSSAGVLVMFHAPWCAYCKQLRPEYVAAAGQIGDQLGFGAVDCTEHRGLCQEHQIEGFPTVKYLSSSSDVTREVTGRTAREFLEFGQEHGIHVTPQMFENAETASEQEGEEARGQVVDEAVKFETFTSCTSCVKAGHGWCPIRRMCGGFQNKDCRGAVSYTHLTLPTKRIV